MNLSGPKSVTEVCEVCDRSDAAASVPTLDTRFLLSPRTMKLLTLQSSVVRFTSSAIPHRTRGAWRTADVSSPRPSRQDVKPHPDRSSLVSSSKLQFLSFPKSIQSINSDTSSLLHPLHYRVNIIKWQVKFNPVA